MTIPSVTSMAIAPQTMLSTFLVLLWNKKLIVVGLYPMASFKQRNDPVRLFWRRLLMLVLIVLVLFGIWAVIGVYIKERESSDLRQQAEAQLKDLQTRETALNEKISSLETARGQEAALRDEYQVGKDGEGMITIVEQPASTTTPEPQGEESWWQKIFWWW